MVFHCGIINWKLLLKIMKELFQVKKKYYWFSYGGLNKIISKNPYDHLESEKKGGYKNRTFIIDNKECLCGRGLLHPMKAIKGKYIPGNELNIYIFLE